MVKNYLIYLLVIFGIILIVAGLMQGNILWVIFGSFMIFLAYFVYERNKKKSFFEYYYRGREEKVKKIPPKKIKIKFILLSLLSFIVFIALWNLVTNLFSDKSLLNLQIAINEGCKELDPKTFCKKDPSKIIIPYDVNGDGIVGGVNDSLSAVFEKRGCVGECVKKSCGCP